MKDKITIKVRGYHLDVYGHVNNTRYLEFLEEARWAVKDHYFDFPDFHEQGFAIVIVNTNINYRRPAGLGDLLEIHTYIKKIGSRSSIFRHEIYQKGTDRLIADADVTFVIMDTQTGHAVQLTPDWRQRLEQLKP